MKNIFVNKKELLEKIIKNKEIHVKNYKEAIKEYKKEALKKLEKLIEKINNAEPKDVLNINTSINLVKPMSFEEEYDKAIRMLEWNLDVKIELDEKDFNSYVLDNWGWKDVFTTSTMSYSSFGK